MIVPEAGSTYFHYGVPNPFPQQVLVNRLAPARWKCVQMSCLYSSYLLSPFSLFQCMLAFARRLPELFTHNLCPLPAPKPTTLPADDKADEEGAAGGDNTAAEEAASTAAASSSALSSAGSVVCFGAGRGQRLWVKSSGRRRAKASIH